MSNLQKLYRMVKSVDWSKAVLSLYIVHRTITPENHQALYRVLGVNVDVKLRKKLRDIAHKSLSASNGVTPYDFNTTDQDDWFLGISAAETDMEGVLSSLVPSANSNAMVSSNDDLLGAWLYIARLDVFGQEPLFAVRRVSQSWTTKKVTQLITLVFSDNVLVDIDEEAVFKIDARIDFFAYSGAIFIVDKKNFEASLNFRAGMEKARDEVARGFVDAGVIGSCDEFVALIGNNMKRLRKLAQVKKSGYYRNTDFMKNLKNINATEGWGLKFNIDGTFIVTNDNVETILRILNNDRLRSPVNSENFDVDVKHKI